MILIKPKRIRLLLSYACNASCFYCHNEGQTIPSATKIGPEFVGKLLDIVPTEEVILSGGEPTLHPDIVSIAKEVKKRAVYLSMNTNGYSSQKLESLSTLVDEIKVNVDAVDKQTYETIKKLPYEQLLRNLLMLKKRGVHVKINTPFVSIKNALGIIDFSLKNAIEVKFIELLKPDLGRPEPSLDDLEAILREKHYSITEAGSRKIATNSKSRIILMRCYCSEAAQKEDISEATELCREKTDLYVTPEGDIKPCIYGLTSIQVYESVMQGNDQRIQKLFDQFDRQFGVGLCTDIISARLTKIKEANVCMK